MDGTLAAAQRTAPRVQTAFCRSDGSGFLAEQPADQLERWSPMVDNGTHLVIDWRADPRLCGRNVTSYFVEVSTSTPVLNFFIGRFGSFPQDLCAAEGSKARDAVQVEEEQPVCSPYEAWCARKDRRTAFEIPAALLQLLKWDVEVTVRAYGSHAALNRPGDVVAASWWCHKYRRASSDESYRDEQQVVKRRRGLPLAALSVGAAAAAAAGTAGRMWPDVEHFGAAIGSAIASTWRPLQRLTMVTPWRGSTSAPRTSRWQCRS
jgi:hypothetical protein